ncbi:MAG: phage tail sheath C-terminal domain-containing protein [Bacteroidota bacterium]
MPSTYRTPGVYIEEISIFPPSVAAVETAIPAFIGFTEKAERNGADLTNQPFRITSLLEYETYFGGPQKEVNILATVKETQDEDGNRIGLEVNADFNGDRSIHHMYYALQMFFANGGGPCYIVSVGGYTEPVGTLLSAGNNNSGLTRGLNEVAKEDEVTLIVFPESQGMSDADTYYGLANLALQQCANLQDRFAVIDVFDTSDDIDAAINGEADTSASPPTFNGVRSGITQELRYGAVYYPNLESSLDYAYDQAQVELAHHLNEVDDSGALHSAMMSAVEESDLQVYNQIKLAIGRIPMNISPSSAVVGVYARVDNARGVWKAPANEALNLVIKPTIKITNDIQNGLNVHAPTGKSINAIRAFTGKGTLIWGARTLLGNDNEWRYVPVRRFFNFAEESIKKATERFVFEPNDANTWTKVRAMIENFLLLQWRAGALAGAKPEDAFFVNVGLGATMTALDILEGRMNVEIGMAVVRPAEFIILKFSHKMQES